MNPSARADAFGFSTSTWKDVDLLGDVLTTVQFLTDLRDRHTKQSVMKNMLFRSLRIEIATNLNLIRTVHDKLKKSSGDLSAETMHWLMSSLSVDAMRAVLINDPQYIEDIPFVTYDQEDPEISDSLM